MSTDKEKLMADLKALSQEDLLRVIDFARKLKRERVSKISNTLEKEL